MIVVSFLKPLFTTEHDLWHQHNAPRLLAATGK